MGCPTSCPICREVVLAQVVRLLRTLSPENRDSVLDEVVRVLLYRPRKLRIWCPLGVLDAHLATGQWRLVMLLPSEGRHPVTRPSGALLEAL